MCFSATASFGAALVLIPAGIYCLKLANELDESYWALAVLPLMFGLQQMIEGGVWLALISGDAASARVLSLGFLMFSHVIWLGWVGFSSYLTESSPHLQRLFLAIGVFGLALGLSMYVPLVLHAELLHTSIINHAIYYELTFVHDYFISQQVLTAVYAAVILLPLMLSSDRYHRVLGMLVFVSGVLTWAFFGWVFVSVWCYFAALISLYLFFMIIRSVRYSRFAHIAR
jgi:hypothetical protein